jgi:hypothetical protein
MSGALMLTNAFDVSTHPLYRVFPVLFQMVGSFVELAADAPKSHENPRIAAANAVKASSRRQRELLAEMTMGHLNRHISQRWGNGTFGLGTDYAFTKQLREKRFL